MNFAGLLSVNLRSPTSDKNGRHWASQAQPVPSRRFSGVSQLSNGLWRSQIQVNGRDALLGTFTSEVDAANCFDKAAVQYFGSADAPTNFKVSPSTTAAWLSEALPRSLACALKEEEYLPPKPRGRQGNVHVHAPISLSNANEQLDTQHRRSRDDLALLAAAASVPCRQKSQPTDAEVHAKPSKASLGARKRKRRW